MQAIREKANRTAVVGFVEILQISHKFLGISKTAVRLQKIRNGVKSRFLYRLLKTNNTPIELLWFRFGVLFILEAPPGFGPGIRVLQTRALPLGHGAILRMPYYYSKVAGICQGVFEINLINLKGTNKHCITEVDLVAKRGEKAARCNRDPLQQKRRHPDWGFAMDYGRSSFSNRTRFEKLNFAMQSLPRCVFSAKIHESSRPRKTRQQKRRHPDWGAVFFVGADYGARTYIICLKYPVFTGLFAFLWLRWVA